MGLPCRYSSDKAGQYELAVKSSLDGEPLAGSPFSLTVTPGELSPAHCTALLAHSGDCLTAGSQALICIQAKDRFGNNVRPSAQLSQQALSLVPDMPRPSVLLIVCISGSLICRLLWVPRKISADATRTAAVPHEHALLVATH